MACGPRNVSAGERAGEARVRQLTLMGLQRLITLSIANALMTREFRAGLKNERGAKQRLQPIQVKKGSPTMPSNR